MTDVFSEHDSFPHFFSTMHRPASVAFVEWEVETIIAMHSDGFRLSRLLGMYWMYDLYDACFFSCLSSPFFLVPETKRWTEAVANGNCNMTAVKVPSSLRRVWQLPYPENP